MNWEIIDVETASISDIKRLKRVRDIINRRKEEVKKKEEQGLIPPRRKVIRKAIKETYKLCDALGIKGEPSSVWAPLSKKKYNKGPKPQPVKREKITEEEKIRRRKIRQKEYYRTHKADRITYSRERLRKLKLKELQKDE